MPQKGASASLTEGPRGVAHLGAVISQIVPPTYEPQYTDLLRYVASWQGRSMVAKLNAPLS